MSKRTPKATEKKGILHAILESRDYDISDNEYNKLKRMNSKQLRDIEYR